MKVEPLATFCVCACSVSSDPHHCHHLIIASSLFAPLLCLGSRARCPSFLSDAVCRTWPRRMARPHPQDDWLVCVICGCYQPFAGLTDTCCLRTRGMACLFSPRDSSDGAVALIRPRGPPRGSRSRSRGRGADHDTIARAAHAAASREADRAEAGARAAETAAQVATDEAFDAFVSASAAQGHAREARAASKAAAAPARPKAPRPVGPRWWHEPDE